MSVKVNSNYGSSTYLSDFYPIVKKNDEDLAAEINRHETETVLDHPDSSVTTAKIADSAVITGKIKDKAVTTNKIADSAVTEAKIANAAVTSSKLAVNAVTRSKILDGEVTTEKIADKAVGAHNLGGDVIRMLKNKTEKELGELFYNAICEGYAVMDLRKEGTFTTKYPINVHSGYWGPHTGYNDNDDGTRVIYVDLQLPEIILINTDNSIKKMAATNISWTAFPENESMQIEINLYQLNEDEYEIQVIDPEGAELFGGVQVATLWSKTVSSDVNLIETEWNYPIVSFTATALSDILSDFNKKADKHNENGGFEGGVNASTTNGGAVGFQTTSIAGGAVGRFAKSGHGGAVGNVAIADYGGAVGAGAKTSDGFAGGRQAICKNKNGNYIDAVQLGTGTNQTPKSVQAYNYTLMNPDGTIPNERVPEIMDALSDIADVSGDYVIEPVVEGITEKFTLRTSWSMLKYATFLTKEVSLDVKYRLFAGDTPMTDNILDDSEATVTATGGFEGDNITIRIYSNDTELFRAKLKTVTICGRKIGRFERIE